jgi:hypothetical protein
MYRESGGSLPVSIHSTRLRSVIPPDLNGLEMTGAKRQNPVSFRPV